MKADGEPIGRKEAEALYRQGRTAVVTKIISLSKEIERLREENARLSDSAAPAGSPVSPTTPSGAIAPFDKPNSKKRKRRPGQKKGHVGTTRKRPDRIDRTEIHPAPDRCPHCHDTLVSQRTRMRDRFIEGIRTAASEIARHVIYGRYCLRCERFVEKPVTEAMANDRISLYTFAFTAYLHYGMGLSIRHCVEVLEHSGLTVSPGALAQGWQRLATLLTPAYDQILDRRLARLHQRLDLLIANPGTTPTLAVLPSVCTATARRSSPSWTICPRSAPTTTTANSRCAVR